MYIVFKSTKLKKTCETFEAAAKKWGFRTARKLIQRLNEIYAADSLRDLKYIPAAHCHSLKGKREGQYAVALEHPYRLIFESLEPDVTLADEALSTIKEVRILEVIDYHG